MENKHQVYLPSVLVLAAFVSAWLIFRVDSPGQADGPERAATLETSAPEAPVTASAPDQGEGGDSSVPWRSREAGRKEMAEIREFWHAELLGQPIVVNEHLTEFRIDERQWQQAVADFTGFARRDPVAAGGLVSEMQAEFREFWLERWSTDFGESDTGEVDGLRELLLGLEGEFSNRLAWSITETWLARHGEEETRRLWSKVDMDGIGFDPSHAIPILTHHGSSTAAN